MKSSPEASNVTDRGFLSPVETTSSPVPSVTDANHSSALELEALAVFADRVEDAPIAHGDVKAAIHPQADARRGASPSGPAGEGASAPGP